MADVLEGQLLQAVSLDGGVTDSGDLAEALGVDHNKLVGTIKSLLAYEMIATEVPLIFPSPPFSPLLFPGRSRLTLSSPKHPPPPHVPHLKAAARQNPRTSSFSLHRRALPAAQGPLPS